MKQTFHEFAGLTITKSECAGPHYKMHEARYIQRLEATNSPLIALMKY